MPARVVYWASTKSRSPSWSKSTEAAPRQTVSILSSPALEIVGLGPARAGGEPHPKLRVALEEGDRSRGGSRRGRDAADHVAVAAHLLIRDVRWLKPFGTLKGFEALQQALRFLRVVGS